MYSDPGAITLKANVVQCWNIYNDPYWFAGLERWTKATEEYIVIETDESKAIPLLCFCFVLILIPVINNKGQIIIKTKKSQCTKVTLLTVYFCHASIIW